MDTQATPAVPTPRVLPWLRRVIVDWGIITACFYAAYQFPHPAVWALCIVVIGARQHALAILAHDGAHRLVCRHRWLNDALTGLLCFWPLGFPMGGYRRFHFAHHRDVGTDEDPELIHKNHRWLGQWQAPLKPWKLTLEILADFVGGAIPHLGMAAYLTRPKSWRDQIGPVIFVSAVLALSWYLEMLWIPLLWFASLWTAFFVFFRMRLWTEHVGTKGTHVITANWWQRFLFLPHNTWCHYEHHEHPSVPCWALPAFRDPALPSLSVNQLLRDLANFRRPQPSDRPVRGGDIASEPSSPLATTQATTPMISENKPNDMAVS